MNFIHGFAIGLLALGLTNQQQQPATSNSDKATDQSLTAWHMATTPYLIFMTWQPSPAMSMMVRHPG